MKCFTTLSLRGSFVPIACVHLVVQHIEVSAQQAVKMLIPHIVGFAGTYWRISHCPLNFIIASSTVTFFRGSVVFYKGSLSQENQGSNFVNGDHRHSVWSLGLALVKSIR